MDLWAILFSYAFIGLALATASVTLTRARVFKPIRDWFENKQFLLFKLVSCPYCMSHWLALWLVPFTMYSLTEIWLVDALLTWFFLVGAAALFEGAIMHGLLMQESYIQELEEEVHTLGNQLRGTTQLITPEEYERAKEQAYRNGQINGQKLERERFAAMDVRLREPITPS